MKISRKLTTVASVGGPSCTVSVNVWRGCDFQGLVKIDGTLSLGSLHPTYQT